MKINIYDDMMKKVAVIENRYISCFWAEGYNSAQPFTLEVPNSNFLRGKILTDYYVGRTDRKTMMVIESVETTKDKIVATGRQATALLDNVAFVDTLKAGSVIDKVIPQAYNQRKTKCLDFKETNLNVRYAQQISNKSFLELSETVADATDTGLKVIRNGKRLVAEFYKPSEEPKKTFSEAFGNLMINSILSDEKSYKNYAIVLGEGTGNERIRVDVDLSGGADKRELIVDARDQQSDKETPAEYQAKLKARGTEKLLEHQPVFKIAVTPDSSEFMKSFDLGDVVSIRTEEYNFQARIIRFQQKSQNNQIETIIEIGQIRR